MTVSEAADRLDGIEENTPEAEALQAFLDLAWEIEQSQPTVKARSLYRPLVPASTLATYDAAYRALHPRPGCDPTAAWDLDLKENYQ